MPLDSPFRLGPFSVDDQGGLTPQPEGGAGFSVRWRGCVVRAALVRAAGEAMELRLRAVLGRVPSSADAAERREEVLAALRALAGGAAGVGLSADHRVVLEATRRLEGAVTCSMLVGAVAGFMLAAAPYGDFFAESGATPAGMVNTWPG